MRHLGMLLAGFLVTGCASRADGVFAADSRILTGTSGAIPGYAVKLVAEKQAGTDVLGGDGSVCRLTRERYQRVRVGDWLSCNWTITT